MAHDVFISYSLKDKAIADGICASLEAAGIRCWIAPRDLGRNRDARKATDKATERAIAHCRVQVLVFSAHANASVEITQELYRAAKANAVLIPVKIDDTVPVLEKQYYLGRPQWHATQNPPTAEQLQLLVERVQAVLKGSKPLPIRTGLAWFYLIPSVLILLGLLAGLVSIVASAQVGLLRLPTSIPIAVAASATPTPPPSPTQTRTLVPSVTITRYTADQVRAFAAPILAAIANKPPNFQDDFGNQSGEWKSIRQQDQPGYIDGEFLLVAPPNSCNSANSLKLPQFSDLVLEIDGRADLSNRGGDWQAQFRVGTRSSYSLRVCLKSLYLSCARRFVIKEIMAMKIHASPVSHNAS